MTELENKVHWRPGPPPGRGRWWVCWAGDDGPRVRLFEVSPAVIHYDSPAALLLMKSPCGMAWQFEANRDRMTHHAPVVAPDLPALRGEHR